MYNKRQYMKESSYQNYFVLGLVLIVVLFFAAAIIFFSEQKNNKESIKTQGPLSLGNVQNSSGNTYKDPVCGMSFNYPSIWKQSRAKLPLPQIPLSQIVFDEPAIKGSQARNSLFSFICYDGAKYSFDQFMADGGSDLKKESLNVGGLSWIRAGNYIYTTQNNKLYILQMFFTKYDMRPETQYENTFMDILKSVRFN